MNHLLAQMLPPTQERVRCSTTAAANRRIAAQIERNVQRFANATAEEIDERLRELEREWDVERMLATAMSLQVLVGFVLGMLVDRRWHRWSAIVAGFLLLHALHGWCPPLLFLRPLGFRTSAEITEEMNALRVLRGDFIPTSDAEDALSQARALHPGG